MIWIIPPAQASMLAEDDGTEVLVRELYKRLPDGPIDWKALAEKAPHASYLSLNNVLVGLASALALGAAMLMSRS